MNKISRFGLQLLCILFLLMPMIAKSDTGIYIEGMSTNNTDLLSMPNTEFRYSRTNPLGISNLNYFWRVGSNLDLSIIYNSTDNSFTTFIGFNGGVGLSYHLRKSSQWTLTPYFGLFLSDHIDVFSTEFGIEIDLWSKISLIGAFNHSLNPVANTKAFRLGINIH